MSTWDYKDDDIYRSYKKGKRLYQDISRAFGKPAASTRTVTRKRNGKRYDLKSNYYAKGYTTRPYRRFRKRISLRRRVRALEPECQVYRQLASGYLDCAINQVNYVAIGIGNESSLNTVIASGVETAVTGGTTSNVNPHSIVNSGNIRVNFPVMQRVIVMKNNNNSAVNFIAYWVRPIRDTVQGPLSTCIDGYEHEGGGTGFLTDPRVGPLCISLFRSTYKVQRKKSYKLLPGETVTLTVSSHNRYFDYQRYDEEQIEYRSFLYTGVLFRIQGDVAHDTTTDELVGTAACSMDYVQYLTYKYNFGKGLQMHKENPQGSFDAVAVAEGVNLGEPNTMETANNAE